MKKTSILLAVLLGFGGASVMAGQKDAHSDAMKTKQEAAAKDVSEDKVKDGKEKYSAMEKNSEVKAEPTQKEISEAAETKKK